MVFIPGSRVSFWSRSSVWPTVTDKWEVLRTLPLHSLISDAHWQSLLYATILLRMVYNRIVLAMNPVWQCRNLEAFTHQSMRMLSHLVGRLSRKSTIHGVEEEQFLPNWTIAQPGGARHQCDCLYGRLMCIAASNSIWCKLRSGTPPTKHGSWSYLQVSYDAGLPLI